MLFMQHALQKGEQADKHRGFGRPLLEARSFTTRYGVFP